MPGEAPHAPSLELGDLTRFTDIWLDNIITDLAVMRRVERAQGAAERSLATVSRLRRRLGDRAAELSARLAVVEAERERLLNSP
ncbi:hypothetical protein GA0070624_4229 [Micromonospora rhizosphaerae]|uniref:Uncharacterized protein n=1 Tax=Micromonospora rhizosphaerae TaxID=568872 RepID=A0A1C6SNP2_9ACTN|nr:hypothetical protein [Micromonospora rhizosphaerae]SCL31226.1 hypothetical protein GA0070624_4229 [Micromonospora rhizosphaerae]